MQVRLWHLIFAVFMLACVFGYVRAAGPATAFRGGCLVALLLVLLACSDDRIIRRTTRSLDRRALAAGPLSAALLNLTAFLLRFGFGLGHVVLVVLVVAGSILTVGFLAWIFLEQSNRVGG